MVMDVGTNLVAAYLNINGYFTASDYPLVESRRGNASRTFTDIDLLAVRFGRAGKQKASSAAAEGARKVEGPLSAISDPMLGCHDELTDMIVAEVKQGQARINPAASNPRTLEAALTRFGCCLVEEAPSLVQQLMRHGRAQGSSGHVMRMVLFASRGDHPPHGWHLVHLDHVFHYLDDYLRSNQDMLGVVDLHDPALSWLALLQKCNIELSSEDAKN